jgi:aminopeptidase N
VAEAVGRPAPDWILPSGGGLGYGLFVLDRVTLRYFAQSLHEIADPLSRGAAVVTLWEAMLTQQVSPGEVIDELVRAVAVERDELNLQRMLDYTSTALWRFTAEPDRPALAARLEPVLRAGLRSADATSVRAAWFNTLRSVAILPDTLAWLEAVWRREVGVPGLPLSETDESDLALDLAMRDLPGSAAMLQAQLSRIENPDRRARFAFLMPAASSDQESRDRFFDSLRTPAARARESWVIDALRYLNHPLRASSSGRYVRPSLELLREIQQTGDIFFPKRWADATLSGYQAGHVSAEVEAFISSLPETYPERLRWILLSSADPLFRASRLLQ